MELSLCFDDQKFSCQGWKHAQHLQGYTDGFNSHSQNQSKGTFGRPYFSMINHACSFIYFLTFNQIVTILLK